MAIAPAKRLRGRRGTWAPGDKPLPMIDLGYQRVSEDVEGANLMKQIQIQRPELRDLLQRIYHTPMGGLRQQRTGAILKAQGARKGVPDYCLPLARGGYHGLYIELKAGDGVLDKEQSLELERLQADGYRAVCCWGAPAAFGELVRYVAL